MDITRECSKYATDRQTWLEILVRDGRYGERWGSLALENQEVLVRKEIKILDHMEAR